MKTAIISTGDELLRGVIADTNAAWIAARLLELRNPASLVTVVGDDADAIGLAVLGCLRDFDLTVVSGGLGPTTDDLTATAVAKVLGRPLVRDELAASMVRAAFARIGRGMHEINLKQADLPEGALVLENPSGTAPGFVVERDGAKAVFLPGVPAEMRRMFDLHVSRLVEAAPAEHSAVFACFGMGESAVQVALAPLEEELAGVRLAFRAAFPELFVTVFAPDAVALELASTRIAATLGSAIFSRRRERLPESLGAALLARGLTAATAESCTGGLISHALTSVPGASGHFKGAIVAYDNSVKVGALGVAAELIGAKGAVSEEVARAMARGVARALEADVAMATTGIAGPDGGTPEKPVGLVHIAVVHPFGEAHQRCVFRGYDRARVQEAAAWTAMRMALEAISERA